MKALILEVLKALREAERVASEHEPGTPDHEAAVLAVEELESIYARLTDTPLTGDLIRQAMQAMEPSET